MDMDGEFLFMVAGEILIMDMDGEFLFMVAGETLIMVAGETLIMDMVVIMVAMVMHTIEEEEIQTI